RFAHALSFQRLRWASADLPRPHPTVVTHRDIRDRIATLLPFFTQGSTVTPIVLGDSLFWVLDLYSASSSYPLSKHIQIAGDDRTYFQHSATAMVLASTGETIIVADSTRSPIARTWMTRFPSLFPPWSSLPPALRAQLPPALDATRALAIAFGEYGTRSDSDFPRHLPVLDGADSALANSPPHFLVPGSRADAVGFALLD